MSIDLTGITNRNEFFTQHYLAEYFEAAVKGRVDAWKDEAKRGQGPNPASELGRLRQTYPRARAAFDEATGEPRRRALSAEAAGRLMAALGYPEPAAPAAGADPAGAPEQDAWPQVALEDGTPAPVWREYLGEGGAPQVWAVLALEPRDADAGVFAAQPLGPGLVPAARAHAGGDDDALEPLIDSLFFRTPEPARFVLVLTMGHVLLCDRNKWGERRCLEFDVREVLARKQEEAAATLLAHACLCPQGAPLIDELDAQSGRSAAEVSGSLKYALRECVELLGNEVVWDWVHNKGRDVAELDAGQLTTECLRYMYRILFLLFMEARPELGFAPMRSDSYLKGYSFEALRDLVADLGDDLDAAGDTDYINQSLNRLFDLVYDGYPLSDEQMRRFTAPGATYHDMFLVPPLKAHIFDQQNNTPHIRDARLRDRVTARIVDLMSVTRPDGKRRRQRISYATLGINQLGSVYEALLSYRGFIAGEDLYEVKRANDAFDELDVGYFVPASKLDDYDEGERVRYESGPREGDLRVHRKGEFIYRLAGRERETSASYYTPECLTRCLVGHALEELLAGKTAAEVLDLKVIEPAMGSAAFLNEAISQLAEAYLRLRQAELGRTVPAEERDYELQRVKMYIADRNVYGVDLNPIAVELGEVSLWLNSISRDGFVPWFGNQLHCGNSLVGARRRGYTEGELSSADEDLRWFNKEPERIGYETGCSKSHRVYHFLVGDPAMCAYDDKAVRELEPQALKEMKAWRKELKRPYQKGQIESLRRLSRTVDDLWARQVEQQRRMERETRDILELWGYTDTAQTSHNTIREKDAIYARYYLSEHERNAGPYARLKFAMDYWCALWFWPIEESQELPSRDELLLDMSLILEGSVATAVKVARDAVGQGSLFELGDDDSWNDLRTPEQKRIAELEEGMAVSGEVDIDRLCSMYPRMRIARDVAARQHFFHWELEFADVFATKGGFDLALGNPPWLKLEWNEQAALGDVDPKFAVKALSANQTKDLRPEALKDAHARSYYLASYESLAAQKAFLNAGQNYPLLKGQQTNLYRCFLPQAWDYTCADGVSAFVHPDGILNDSNALALRRVIGLRLRKHFQFANELKIFEGVDHHTTFSLNVYGGVRGNVDFVSISNLYHPSTIEGCLHGTADGPVEGVKDADGKWNTKGHPGRAIHITEAEMRTFAKLLGDDDWRGARIPNVHAAPLLEVLEAIAEQPCTLGDLGADEVFTSECWHETNSRKDGTLKDCIGFPESAQETIYSSAFLGVANPLYQTTRPVYLNNHDYDPVDLTDIPDDYRVRTKYRRACTPQEYGRRMPKTPWGKAFNECWRLANREYVGCTSERTLQAALMPPGPGWIHKVFGFATPCLSRLVALAGYTSSLPLDYFVRAAGKADVNYATTMQYPVVDSPLNPEISARALLLNCLTGDYAPLWHECWLPEYAGLSWAKADPRLPASAFAGKGRTWTWDSPLRTDYARRQALVELDVLCSLALGLTLEQLQTVYRLDFSVLKGYEDDTYYDANGHMVFSSKKELGPSVLDRKTFEPMKAAASGTFDHTYTDDTQPGGPRERTLVFEAPFDRCDRAADYVQAWAFFAAKYGMGV